MMDAFARVYKGIIANLLSVCIDVRQKIHAAISLTKHAVTDEKAKVVNFKAKKKEYNEKAEYYLNEYGDSMLRMAYSYLHNYSDSEEIIQDAIIKILSSSASFENKAHEKSYLLTIVANLSKNRIKYNKLREVDELSEELVAGEENELSFVWDAVKGLPEKYREVIHLFYYEGYSTAEIADIIGANENTVRSNLSRARLQLKNILKEEYDFE